MDTSVAGYAKMESNLAVGKRLFSDFVKEDIAHQNKSHGSIASVS
jgi:hypothetical protein